MRRIKLVVALAATMVVLMMAAAPAMANGFRVGSNHHGGDNDITFSAPTGATFFATSNNNGLNDFGDNGDNLLFFRPGLDIFSSNNGLDLNNIDNGDFDIDID